MFRATFVNISYNGINVANIDFVVNSGSKCYIANKAIRDGKYLAPPHASAWQRSPH